MSAQEMCSVPTPDGEVEVPVGTAILLDDGTLGFAGKGGYWIRLHYVGNDYPFRYGDHTATIIAVPDGNGGWITPGATPEPERVALTPEQVAVLPNRTPVRVEWGGVVTEGALDRDLTRDGRVALHHPAGHWWTGSLPHVTVHAHPEDVPVDPEYDRIERMAKAVYEDRYSGTARTEWDSTSETLRDIHRQMARVALAAFREETR